MAVKKSRRPVKRKSSSSRPASRKPASSRKRTVRSSAGAPAVRRMPIPRQSDDEAMLSEFSDETNDFYVDEHKERSRRAEKAAKEKKQNKKSEPRKPLSPIQRKIIRIISYAAIVTVVLIVGVVLSLTVLFKTQTYEVTGSTKYTDSELIEAGGITKGQNIFLAPKRPAEKRIKSEFPYVEDVSVSFKIPDTIKIGVTEAVEGYLIKVSDTQYLVISTKGRILESIENKGSYDLPIFIGPKPVTGEPGEYVSYEDESVLTMIDSITQTFADNGYQGITEIDATDTADISFTYDDRVKVKLGIPEDLDYKIRTAMTIIIENLDKNQTGTVQGVLDVSRCNSTRRSYFNEQELHPTEAPTQDPSQPSTDAYTGDYSGDYTGDYEWTDDSYSDDSYDWSYDAYDENGYGYFY